MMLKTKDERQLHGKAWLRWQVGIWIDDYCTVELTRLCQLPTCVRLRALVISRIRQTSAAVYVSLTLPHAAATMSRSGS